MENRKNDEVENLYSVIRYLVNEVYSQAASIKMLNASNDSFQPYIEWGKLFAYAEVLSVLKKCADENNIELDDLFEGDFNPYEILNFVPKNWPNNKLFIPSNFHQGGN